jgi:hypothetical protein
MKIDERFKHEIESRIVMEKAAFDKNKTLFTLSFGLKFNEHM